VARTHDVLRTCNRRKLLEKPSHLTELGVIFSVLARAAASIAMTELWFLYRNHKPMIRHQL